MTLSKNYSYQKNGKMFITAAVERELCSVRVWNYNRSVKTLNKGTRDVEVRVDNKVLWKGELEKGCGSQIFDYEKKIPVDCGSLQAPNLSTSFIVSPKSDEYKAAGLVKVTRIYDVREWHYRKFHFKVEIMKTVSTYLTESMQLSL